jgi:hypothetical protein
VAHDIKAKILLENMNKINGQLNESNILWEIIEKFDIKSIEVHEHDGFYIGRDWSSIKDDETGAQFKNSIKEEIKKILEIEDVSFSTYEESFSDG